MTRPPCWRFGPGAAMAPDRRGRTTLASMSAERDELRRLIDELPEDQVPAVLQEVRQHTLAASDRPWPPVWFGSVKGGAKNVSARVDELLAEGFGR